METQVSLSLSLALAEKVIDASLEECNDPMLHTLLSPCAIASQAGTPRLVSNALSVDKHQPVPVGSVMQASSSQCWTA